MRRALQILLRVPLALAAVACGLLLAEGCMRVLVPYEIMLETWFTPGIHTYDEEMGFIYTPNYHGQMRHADGLWVGEPLTLDAHGFRQPALPPDPGPDVQRVVLLGGRSLMMSYGLPDEATIHHRLAAHLDQPTEVCNTAWAGDSLWRNWHYLNREMGDEPPFDVAIIALVSPYLPAFEGLTDYTFPVDHRPESAIFPFVDGVVLWRGPLFRAHPRLSHASYLSFILFRHADRGLKAWRGWRNPSPARPKDIVSGSPEELAGFVRFLEHLRGELAARGTSSIVVMLPRRGDPAHCYEALTAVLPDDLPWFDLHAEFEGTLGEDDFFADGHYRAPLADRIAQRLAAAMVEAR